MHAPPTLRRSLAIPEELGRISLAELNAAASMLTRVDRKYALKRVEAESLIADLDRGTRVLDIEGITAHSYASTYFDTPALDSFRGTAQPRRRRYKIRIRSYLDSGLAFLEVKTRGPRGRTVKERIPYDPGAALEGVLTPRGGALGAPHDRGRRMRRTARRGPRPRPRGALHAHDSADGGRHRARNPR